MTGYFKNFPVINYMGQNVVDVTKRVVFANSSLSNPYVFYPYDISNNERPDQFANRYYDDSYKDWIIYLGNKILDPYYQYYVNDKDFNKFINLKYGSYQLAENKIAYYENNWYSAYPSTIPKNYYDALPYTLLKYWEPVYDVYNNIKSYERIQNNDTITTNGIRSYTTSSNNFILDEICTVVYDYNANNVGYGQVMSISNNTLYLQHLSGNTISNTSVNSYIYGQQSQTNTSFSNPNLIVDNLLPEEVVYWNPVTYLQHEINKNEKNKTINVLDKSYSGTASKILKNILTSNT